MGKERQGKEGDILGILSLKGGVGKTSIVSSLGAAISDFQRKVLLVDANLSAPNLGMHLRIVDPKVSLHHVLEGSKTVKSAIQHLDYFDLIPSSIFFDKQINPLRLKNKLKPLKNEYDFIIIDSSPALNDETLAVMMAADRLLVVTTPDYPTLSSTLKAIVHARRRGVKIDGLILNKVYGKSFELTIREIEDTLDVPVLAVIPEDEGVVNSISKFTPFFKHKPHSKGAEEFKKLAAVLIGEKYRPFNLRRILGLDLGKEEVNRELFYERVFK